uniref:glycosyltransferase n=1 Tax=uncultured Methylobacterium sp. TaxID=157278 RepID=UPI0035C9ADBF
TDRRGLTATFASIERQAYPNGHHAVVESVDSAEAAALADPATRYIVLVRAGDLLAPGALAAMALEAALTGAQVVVGLRILFDRGVTGIDVVAHPSGPVEAALLATADDIAVTGGEFLLDWAAVRKAGGLVRPADRPSSSLWHRLAADGARLARIGRPVLLRQASNGRWHTPAASEGLSIVALTDLGYTAGAGIAHRRLSDALRLAGHRITHRILAQESPPAAAEWTDTFPRSEAAIVAGGHDLVLVGNVHGVTRGTRFLARLAAHLPVAIVLHDLFPLTGRCAFPKGCRLIATGCDTRCPSPDQYPQLSPSRIARAYADKQDVLGGSIAPLLLANSAWTALAAHELAPPGTDIAEIALAFPTGVFQPGDRATLRQRLGLPEGDVIVMFGAVIVDAPGKGFADLSAALRKVARHGISFVAVGRLDDPSVFGLSTLISTGPIGDEATLADWYGACDVYVTASQTETLGQTPIEAGLCGTPTVAYRSCGLTTAVIDGVSGVLVVSNILASERADDLAAELSRLIEDEGLRRHLGAWGRIALENRNSYAAAALRLQDVLASRGIGSAQDRSGRFRFDPALLGHFAFAKARDPGHAGTVPTRSHPAMRTLRRIKHVLLGRGMPFWLRRLLHVSSMVRRRLGTRP